MKSEEKSTWLRQFWAMSVMLAFCLGARIFDDHETHMSNAALVVPLIGFIILVLVWLFRVTYLAGGKRNG